MNSTITNGFQQLNGYISYYKYSYQLRVFDQILVLILFFTFLYYERRITRLEKIIEDCEKCVGYVDGEDDEDSEDDSEDSEDDEEDDNDEDYEELQDSFLDLQNKMDYNLNRLNRKLGNIQSTISRLETDISNDNGIFDQKFKTVENKIHKLNERYASLEVMVDELYDEDESDSESEFDSDYEPEPDVGERTYNAVSIQNYNDKSFAVYGDTRKFKDELKKLGGKWAPKLSGGPGWIFSNNHRESVDKWFMEYFQTEA
jgi:hypothetical protein